MKASPPYSWYVIRNVICVTNLWQMWQNVTNVWQICTVASILKWFVCYLENHATTYKSRSLFWGSTDVYISEIHFQRALIFCPLWFNDLMMYMSTCRMSHLGHSETFISEVLEVNQESMLLIIKQSKKLKIISWSKRVSPPENILMVSYPGRGK